jgi:predicted DNA-binding transcriptional regulator YafY
MARALWILQYLQAHRRVTYPIVLEAFGCSRRSYNRYLSLLRDSGAQLAGHMGGFAGGGVSYLGFDPRLAPCRRDTAA